MTKLVFLGGTAANNTWRDGFIANLVARGVAKEALFNPVVKKWDEAARANEEAAKKNASHHLYYLASPRQEGNPLSTYSMVEAAIALATHSENTVVVFDHEGLEGHAAKAMKQSEKALRAAFPGTNIFGSAKDAEDWLAKELT